MQLGHEQRGLLRERFRRVILSAGYTPEAAESILAKWFEVYLKDLDKFVVMLREYEKSKGDPE